MNIKFFLALILCCAVNCHGQRLPQGTEKLLNLNLTFGTALPNLNGITPSLSANGDQVYLVIENFYENNPVRAQLYNNVNGQLVLAQSVGYDASYPDVWIGYASADFTRFSLLESDHDSMIRIRVFDPEFNVVGTRLITDVNYDAPYGSLSGGSFTADNHYLLIAYTGSVPPFTGPYFTNVLLLDATQPTLPTVASTVIAANNASIPLLFTLTDAQGNNHLYFTFESSEIDSTTGAYEPPYFSEVYGIDVAAGTMSFIAKSPLPINAETDVNVRNNKREALISHGGFCSLFPNQTPTIYSEITPSITTTLPNDNAEARVLLFDGDKLNLVVSQAINCCNRTTAYPTGDGSTYFVGQNVDVYTIPGVTGSQSPLSQEYYCLANLAQTTTVGQNTTIRTFQPQNMPRQDMSSSQVAFSQDGRWYIRTGTYGYMDFVTPLPDANGVNNILLFQVIAAVNTPIG